jgi:hypothetical protein
MKASASILIAMYKGTVSVASAYNIAANTKNSSQNPRALKYVIQLTTPSYASTCKHPSARQPFALGLHQTRGHRPFRDCAFKLSAL